MSSGTEVKHLRIELTENEHQATRLAAAIAGCSMREYVQALLRQALTEARKKNPKIFPPLD